MSRKSAVLQLFCIYNLLLLLSSSSSSPLCRVFILNIPETNYVPREYSVAAILLLLFVMLILLVPVLNLLHFYISTFWSSVQCPIQLFSVVVGGGVVVVVIIIVVVIWMSLITGIFFLILLLNQRWSSLLRLQASHCSTFCIMCDVPSVAVFCSEFIKCFPGTASKFFLKLFVTIPVAPIITGIIVHFRFHLHCISIHKLLYFNFFSASFCTTFLSAGIATSISVHVFSLLFLIIISGLFAVTSLSVCTAWFHNTVTSPSSHTILFTGIEFSLGGSSPYNSHK